MYHSAMTRPWHIKNATLPIGPRTLVMGVLNITPDSFSDGTLFFSPDKALGHAEEMIALGADIVDVGGESTRPGGEPVSTEEEIQRVVPIIAELSKRTRVPVSVDTTKSAVARAAIDAGASIINDISALRFDFHIADVAAAAGAGLILMHSRGTPATMHRLPPVADIMEEVSSSLGSSIKMAERRGVTRERIVIDPGIGFGKSQEQNLELIAKLDQLIASFPDLPLLIGTSRKSFIGRILMDASGNPAPLEERLHGTMASVAAAVLRGARIARVHDVKATVETLRTIDAIRAWGEDVGSKGEMMPRDKVKKAKKKKDESKMGLMEDEVQSEEEPDSTQLKPVRPKIGEDEDNLKQREEWFQKRSGRK